MDPFCGGMFSNSIQFSEGLLSVLLYLAILCFFGRIHGWMMCPNTLTPEPFSYAKNEDIYVQDFLTNGDLASLFHLPLSPQALGEVRELQDISSDIVIDATTHSDD